jgi:hypothetical protein
VRSLAAGFFFARLLASGFSVVAGFAITKSGATLPCPDSLATHARGLKEEAESMMRTLLITTAIAFAVPLAAANAQSVVHTKCGPVSFSNEKMAYTGGPCIGSPDTSGPTANQAAPAGSQSSSMTKAEMKQGVQPGYGPGYAQPMPPQQAQAVSMGPNMASPNMASPNMASPNMALGSDQCGPMNAATIKDEYGRRYNCRGDRIR